MKTRRRGFVLAAFVCVSEAALRFDLVRALVEQVLSANLAGVRADRALAVTLRRQRDLTSEERRHVAELALGIALWRGRLDRMADGDRSLWLPLFLVDREKRTPEAAAALSDVDVWRICAAIDIPSPPDPVERVAFEYSLPLWLARRWAAQFGIERASRIADAMNQRGPISIRTNVHRVTRDELVRLLAAEGVEARLSSLVETGIRLSGRPNIVALQAWREGLFEVQDEGSQLIATAVDAKPGETIVDLCAGAGGKTLALAAAMRAEGRLVAIEPDGQRLADLAIRARRAGVSFIETRQGDARDERVSHALEGSADAVLVDAPCSSLGTLRRGPDARWRLAEDEPEQWSGLQAELLHAASRFVRPGGRVVYATCSIDLSENEAISHSIDPTVLRLEREQHTWPDIDDCDGFFWAVFSKSRTS